MTNAEIGLVLNKSEGAVKSLLRRTLAALKGDLERGQQDDLLAHRRGREMSMSGKPESANAHDLGATGKLVRGPFASMKAPENFREMLLNRLVQNSALPGIVDSSLSTQSNGTPTRPAAARAARRTSLGERVDVTWHGDGCFRVAQPGHQHPDRSCLTLPACPQRG